MPRTYTRPNGPRTACRVTPLNAATLLLLVTMVLASSPVSPPVAFVHPTDPRPASTQTASVENEANWSSQRRKVRGQEQEPTASSWRGLTAPDSSHAATTPVRVEQSALPTVRLIRAALIDLPPPSAC